MNPRLFSAGENMYQLVLRLKNVFFATFLYWWEFVNLIFFLHDSKILFFSFLEILFFHSRHLLLCFSSCCLNLEVCMLHFKWYIVYRCRRPFRWVFFLDLITLKLYFMHVFAQEVNLLCVSYVPGNF